MVCYLVQLLFYLADFCFNAQFISWRLVQYRIVFVFHNRFGRGFISAFYEGKRSILLAFITRSLLFWEKFCLTSLY